ncbi:Zinc metalloproteinase nas-15 [Toxocara canis]|uniref:Metalloendopeptidase n=1 Tax=Toxocara canis TaxID=6265 RepID=A0A0B2V577_TOXCA|nr:Zinc metalloproteinase nas-15 [Toxocara canis]
MYFTVFFLILLALVGADDEFVDKSQPDTETSLTVEDFEHAKLIQQNESEVFNSSEMYHQDLFEGDIVDDDISPSSGRKRRSIMKNAIRHLSLRWPNGRVPYTISQQYNEQGRAVLAAAIEEYAKLTCIRIVPKTSADNDYVHIAPIRGCSSNIGRIGGMQRMSLVSGCLHKGIIVHEFMHALGFFHEQARADRDNYVTVYYENIQPGMESQFHSRPLSEIDHMGTQYDYQSVMHYDTTAFSKNGRPTILPKQQGVTIGQRRGLSPTDIYKINTMYGCSAGGMQRMSLVSGCLHKGIIVHEFMHALGFFHEQGFIERSRT